MLASGCSGSRRCKSSISRTSCYISSQPSCFNHDRAHLHRTLYHGSEMSSSLHYRFHRQWEIPFRLWIKLSSLGFTHTVQPGCFLAGSCLFGRSKIQNRLRSMLDQIRNNAQIFTQNAFDRPNCNIILLVCSDSYAQWRLSTGVCRELFFPSGSRSSHNNGRTPHKKLYEYYTFLRCLSMSKFRTKAWFYLYPFSFTLRDKCP